MLRIVFAVIAVLSALFLGWIGLFLVGYDCGDTPDHHCGEVTVNLPWGDMTGDTAAVFVFGGAVLALLAAIVAVSRRRVGCRGECLACGEFCREL